MAIFLDESDNLTQWHGRDTHKSQHVRGIDGHNLDLILGQGGLKSFEFLDTTGTFDDSRQAVKPLTFLSWIGYPFSSLDPLDPRRLWLSW